LPARRGRKCCSGATITRPSCSIRWQAKSDPICFERFRVDELATLCVLEGRIVKARLV
jgi:hypothetical protein